jgi:RNA polymerase sigma-70 factor (ECF subfamily)
MIRSPRPKRVPDAEAEEFEDFYRSSSGRLFRYASAIASSARQLEAEDACQEAWLKMWRAWDRADPAHREAWALRVVRNCCIDTLRREQRRQSASLAPLVSEEDGRGMRTSEALQPDDALERVADAQAVDAALRKLPEQLRRTLWMREVLGLSYAEMASALGVPIGTVMSRLHSARRRLARELGREDRR